MSATETVSYTYTQADVEEVFRRFSTDIIMIADSTRAITRSKAEDYAHDAEYLAKRGFLKKVDVTLLSENVEKKAAVYLVNDKVGDVTSQRPGGVLWPRVENPWLRVTIWYTSAYTDAIKAQTQPKLKVGWSTSTADTSHSSLSKSGARSYASNGYGLDREDLT